MGLMTGIGGIIGKHDIIGTVRITKHKTQNTTLVFAGICDVVRLNIAL